MRFDAPEYVEQFEKTGKYPAIHNDIFYMDKYLKSFPGAVLDLGCCTGLLSRRLMQNHEIVLGVEANENYLTRAVPGPKYFNLKVSEDTLAKLGDIIRSNGVKIIFARRVIPEIYDTGGFDLVNSLVELFYKNGVNYVVLEGRKPTKNATNPFHGITQEIKSFQNYYNVVRVRRNCVLLKARVFI